MNTKNLPEHEITDINPEEIDDLLINLKDIHQCENRIRFYYDGYLQPVEIDAGSLIYIYSDYIVCVNKNYTVCNRFNKDKMNHVEEVVYRDISDVFKCPPTEA